MKTITPLDEVQQEHTFQNEINDDGFVEYTLYLSRLTGTLPGAELSTKMATLEGLAAKIGTLQLSRLGLSDQILEGANLSADQLNQRVSALANYNADLRELGIQKQSLVSDLTNNGTVQRPDLDSKLEQLYRLDSDLKTQQQQKGQLSDELKTLTQQIIQPLVEKFFKGYTNLVLQQKQLQQHGNAQVGDFNGIALRVAGNYPSIIDNPDNLEVQDRMSRSLFDVIESYTAALLSEVTGSNRTVRVIAQSRPLIGFVERNPQMYDNDDQKRPLRGYSFQFVKEPVVRSSYEWIQKLPVDLVADAGVYTAPAQQKYSKLLQEKRGHMHLVQRTVEDLKKQVRLGKVERGRTYLNIRDVQDIADVGSLVKVMGDVTEFFESEAGVKLVWLVDDAYAKELKYHAVRECTHRKIKVQGGADYDLASSNFNSNLAKSVWIVPGKEANTLSTYRQAVGSFNSKTIETNFNDSKRFIIDTALLLQKDEQKRQDYVDSVAQELLDRSYDTADRVYVGLKHSVSKLSFAETLSSLWNRVPTQTIISSKIYDRLCDVYRVADKKRYDKEVSGNVLLENRKPHTLSKVSLVAFGAAAKTNDEAAFKAQTASEYQALAFLHYCDIHEKSKTMFYSLSPQELGQRNVQ